MRFFAENLLRGATQDSGRRFVNKGDATVAIEAVDTFRGRIQNNQTFGPQAFALLFRGFSGHELPQLAPDAEQQFGEILVATLGSGTKKRKYAQGSGSDAEGKCDGGLRLGESRRRTRSQDRCGKIFAARQRLGELGEIIGRRLSLVNSRPGSQQNDLVS